MNNCHSTIMGVIRWSPLTQILFHSTCFKIIFISISKHIFCITVRLVNFAVVDLLEKGLIGTNLLRVSKQRVIPRGIFVEQYVLYYMSCKCNYGGSELQGIDQILCPRNNAGLPLFHKFLLLKKKPLFSKEYQKMLKSI